MDMPNQIKNVVELAKTVKEVLPNTIVETDGALSTLVGWFNSVVLYPVKKANITYRYKLENFEIELETKTSLIPTEYLHEPNLMIAGPTLEALKYTFDEEELRKMYVNLLASSMDSRKDRMVHPSYVDIIKNINSFDALLFKYLSQQSGYIKIINPLVRIKGTKKVFTYATPEWFIVWNSEADMFESSASLIRLSKLGLIELMHNRTPDGENYDNVNDSVALTKILQRYQAMHTDLDLELTETKSVMFVNDHGRQFAKVCL